MSDGSHSVQVSPNRCIGRVGYRVCVFGSVSEFR